MVELARLALQRLVDAGPFLGMPADQHRRQHLHLAIDRRRCAPVQDIAPLAPVLGDDLHGIFGDLRPGPAALGQPADGAGVGAESQIDGFKLELVKFDPADPCHRSRPVSAATRLSMMAPCAGV